MRVEIIVPETILKKVGAFACKCQRTEIDLMEKEAKVFWKKKLNELVEKDEVLCEIEVEKLVGEIRPPFAGRLTEIFIEDGDNCDSGSLIGILETDSSTTS